MPYKHYSAGVICRVLNILLVLGISIRQAASTAHNAASASRWCVGEWLRQFRQNNNNLRMFGLETAGNSQAAEDAPMSVSDTASDSGLFAALLKVAADADIDINGAFPFWQVKLSARRPPAGLFRAVLLPGCVT